MPEIKRIFTGGKMNKDLDERLLPNGQYRDALNIKVRGYDSYPADEDGDSEGNSGTIQNLQGNRFIGSTSNQTYYEIPSTLGGLIYSDSQFPTCVGSIADEKNDKAYFFFTSRLLPPNNMFEPVITTAQGYPINIGYASGQGQVYRDFIIEQDVNGNTRPVVTDVFAVVDTIQGVIERISGGGITNYITGNYDSSGWSEIAVKDPSRFRVGMTMDIVDVSNNSILPGKPARIKAIEDNVLMLHEPQYVDILSPNNADQLSGAWFVFKADRVLKFSSGHIFNDNNTLNTITGISLIDDLLFWTDGYSEPKKINITRCKAGTSLNGTSHTRLFVNNPQTNVLSQVSSLHDNLTSHPTNFYLQEKHITVIRKAPTLPPTLEMDSLDRNININLAGVSLVDDFYSQSLQNGLTKIITDSSFQNVQLRRDDIIVFTENVDSNPIKVLAKLISYVNDSNEETDQNTDKILVQWLQTNSSVTTGNDSWVVTLSQDKPLFELKLARFGYRYRYEDGEYSSFSPFSDVAFLPGDFNYDATEGYNLGMVNTVRELVIKDFIPYNIPKDVYSIDILYKSTDSANVYVLDTVNRKSSLEWELFTPDGSIVTKKAKTGELNVTSEMIHRVLSPDQTLRTWDNVPRNAKALDITGNRLVYGNYTQGYDLKGSFKLLQNINSEATASLSNPKKSLKSIRNYKVGLVFGDKYGRETPVITSGYTTVAVNQGTGNDLDSNEALTGDIIIPQDLCDKKNSLVVTQSWQGADFAKNDWIDYVKYYVKETSSEYYNLTMDRWYDAGDNNGLWISFNSADRNKVDEETHLLLKNENFSQNAIKQKARYKIISIKNEAPDHIKTTYYTLGRLFAQTIGTGDGLTPLNTGSYTDGVPAVQPGSVFTGTVATAAATSSGTNTGLYTNKYIYISEDIWNGSSIGSFSEEDNSIFNKEIKGKLEFRILGLNVDGGLVTGQKTSEWRTITNYTVGEAGDPADDVKFAKITFNKLFDQGDVDMYTRFNNSLTNGSTVFNPANLKYDIEFRESIVENRPEFDGKFFVKIKKDFIVNQSLITYGDGAFEFQPTGTIQQLAYIEGSNANQASQYETNTGTSTQIDSTAVFDTSNESEEWFNGAFAGLTEDSGSDIQVLFDSAASDSNNDMATYAFDDPSTQTSYMWDPSNIATDDTPTNISPFGILGNTDFNTRTKEFWIWYLENKNLVFIDGVEAALLKAPTTPGGAIIEEGIPGGQVETFHDGGTGNSTIGSMAVSYIQVPNFALQNPFPELNSPYSGAPQLFQDLTTPNTYFQFLDDISDSVYIVQSVTLNQGGLEATINYLEENITSAEATGDNPLPYAGVDDASPAAFRRTAHIVFRKVNESTGLATSNGMDLVEFDPRSFMHHDGRDSIGVRILNKVSSSSSYFVNEEIVNDQGACFETEPKESVDLELYYESTGAIPMYLTKDNVFNFAPINCSVSITRTIGGAKFAVTFGNTIAKRSLNVGNIHFSSDQENQAIIQLNNLYSVNNQSTQFRQLHKENITIGDELEFLHNSFNDGGTVTKARVIEFWKPIDPINDEILTGDSIIGDAGSANIAIANDAFTELSGDDNISGIISGPKAFEKVPEVELLFLDDIDVNGEYNLYILTTLIASLSVNDVVTKAEIATTTDQGYSSISFVEPVGVVVSAIGPETNGVYTKVTFTENSTVSNKWMLDLIDTVDDYTGVNRLTFKTPTGYYGISRDVHNQTVQLPFFNCYTFGNGIESDRIRDDFNAPQLDNGVKVSTTFSGYKEEKIKSGMIYSGLYNSISQVNDLNEFNMANKITKNLNPTYGSIQALKTRDTDLVVFTEDKVLKVLSNKDALFNADGNPQLTASDRVLGQTIPFVGDYGISKNPESLATDQYRMYFTDKQRGAVLRLSRNGLTPISNVGMSGWFRDNLRRTDKILGTFDKVSGEYNVTLHHRLSDRNLNKTVSFSEGAKGWVSFKSFIPSSGLSISGRYLTTFNNEIWEHYVDETITGEPVERNSFYGSQMPSATDPNSTAVSSDNSKVTVMFNDFPSIVKSFKTLNYEGSQARISQFRGAIVNEAYTGNINFDGDGIAISAITNQVNLNDNEYYNWFQKEGWYISGMNTDLQTGNIKEFKNKEGKWFNTIQGSNSDINSLDTSEITVQGVGIVDSVQFTVNNNPNDGSGTGGSDETGGNDGDNSGGGGTGSGDILGCTDEDSINYDENATIDNGSCIDQTLYGCTNPADPLFNPDITNHDESMCAGVQVGCLDNNPDTYGGVAFNYNATNTVNGYCLDVSGNTVACGPTYITGAVTFVEMYYNYNCTYSIENFDDSNNEPVCYDLFGTVVDCSGVQGCTDPSYEEYNENAVISDPTQCINLIPMPGLVVGCTDINACNYNPNANISAECNYTSCQGCTEGIASNYNSAFVIPCPDDSTVIIHPSSGVQVCPCNFNALGGCDNELFEEFGTDQQCNTLIPVLGCMNPLALNYAGPGNTNGIYPPANTMNYNGVMADCEMPNIIYGCLDATLACDGNFLHTNYAGPGNIIGVDPPANVDDGTCFQFNDAYTYGCTDPNYLEYDPDACADDGTWCLTPAVLGCTDATAWNYNESANQNDGSCVPTVTGCTDLGAINYQGPVLWSTAFPNTDTVYWINNYYSSYTGQWSYDIQTNEQTGPNGAAGHANYGGNELCIYPLHGCLDPNASNYNPGANLPGLNATTDVMGNVISAAPHPDCIEFYENGTLTVECYQSGCTYISTEEHTLNIQNYSGDTNPYGA